MGIKPDFYKKTAAVFAAVFPMSFVLHAETGYPNVVLILADDMGYGDVSSFNAKSRIKTSNLDRLAMDGICFTDAHSCSALSTPSRYGLLTGRYAFRTRLRKGVLNGYSPPLIPESRRTLADIFNDAGYHTACIGKWHLGWIWSQGKNGEKVDFSAPVSNGPSVLGFEYYYCIAASLDMPPYVYVENDRIMAVPDHMMKKEKGLRLIRRGPAAPDFIPEECLDRFVGRASDYIMSMKDEKDPFFLYFPLTAPHTPILPSDEFIGKSGLSPYGDFVMMVDDVVGKIIDALRQSGKLDNTIVIFASDNGCAPGSDMAYMESEGHFPSYVFRGAKSDLFEGGHRIPLIVSWGSRYAGGRVEDCLVSLTDLYATFAEITGYQMKENEGEDSFSLLPVLEGNNRYSRKDMVQHSADGSLALRRGRWKLLFTGSSGGWSYPSLPKDSTAVAALPAFQLYNIEKDKSESLNLVSRYPFRVRRMAAIMRKYIKKGRSTDGIPQKNDLCSPWPQTSSFMKKRF